MILDSYEKAALDVLSYLEESKEVLVLCGLRFNSLIRTSGSELITKPIPNYSYVDITDYIPNIIFYIEQILPYPNTLSSMSSHFVTELVGTFGICWISIAAPGYLYALETSLIDDLKLAPYQRGIRALKTTDISELTMLSIDPDKGVRDLALRQIKTL